MRYELKPGDEVYATGAILRYGEDGKFTVVGFEDESYFDGGHVETIQQKDGSITWYIERND